ncbi:MAG: cysteine desulfurase [Sphingomonadales bacterium]|jgi:cysteine desulfurase|nr:cysteine desulfurase [Sphingomonadales bacterium]
MEITHQVYMDYQASTPVDPKVFSEMAHFFGAGFGNPHSAQHASGWKAAAAVEKAARQIGRLIGADPDEIFFTSGATEANNMALLGLARRQAGGKRRRILLSAIEHKSVLALGRILGQQYQYEVEVLPVDGEGRLDLNCLADAISDDVLAVSVMAVNNEIGTIQDIASVSRAARSCGAYFHCDAAQAPLSMDIANLQGAADFISLSGHKMYGPMGIGALYIRRELQDAVEPLIYGGGQQQGLRSGTLPLPLCVGMGEAAELLVKPEAEIEREAIRRRRDNFVQRLMGLGWPVEVNGPPGPDRHPGNANVRFTGFDALDILAAVQPRLAASTGSACTSGIPEPSHVLRAIGLSAGESEASIRFSIGRFTTDDDIESAIQILTEALARFSREDERQLA